MPPPRRTPSDPAKRSGTPPRASGGRAAPPPRKPRQDAAETPRSGATPTRPTRSGAPRASASRDDRRRTSDAPRADARGGTEGARSDRPRAAGGTARTDRTRGTDGPRAPRAATAAPRQSGDRRSDAPERPARPASPRATPRRGAYAAPAASRAPSTAYPADRTPRRDGAPARGPRPDATTRGPRPERRPAPPPGPPIPSTADPDLLPADVRRELRPLLPATADTVARHLVAAGQLLEDDPAAAYEHAKAAKALAARIGSVREAAGVTAYAAGDYAAALAELKAARRITGLPDHLPLLADCERALGRPARALEIANDPARSGLDRAARVELAIVASGARRDLGQPEAAVLALQGPELDGDAVEPWTVRLWYAYADALLAAGRTDDAVTWFTAVAAVDEDAETDAEERLAALSPPAAP